LAVSLRDLSVDDLRPLAGLGVDELVIVEAPPEDAATAGDWCQRLPTNG
jgi:hypothetical protein